ncbi:unnamed protein product [Amaranthus hypochondriacus]
MSSWDQLLGGGISPSTAVAGVASFASGLIAILALPLSISEKTEFMQCMYEKLRTMHLLHPLEGQFQWLL